MNDVFSATATRYWGAIDDLATAIDRGDTSIGLPPYNGGLFDRERTPLLGKVRLGDQVMADVIDALSFEQTFGGRRYISYRDLSVQQLGSIYERLLERELVRDGDKIVVRPNVFARKRSGSYFTPHDLVHVIVEETVEPLVQARLDDFAGASDELITRGLTGKDRIGTLERLDPAERILEMRICDPAMGSGHFLVGLVDYLADRVISVMAEAEALVEDYASPLTRRIDEVRQTIIDNAGSTTVTSYGVLCSNAASTAWTATRWPSSWPRFPSGCTPLPPARRSASSITICAAATASSVAGSATPSTSRCKGVTGRSFYTMH